MIYDVNTAAQKINSDVCWRNKISRGLWTNPSPVNITDCLPVLILSLIHICAIRHLLSMLGHSFRSNHTDSSAVLIVVCQTSFAPAVSEIQEINVSTLDRIYIWFISAPVANKLSLSCSNFHQMFLFFFQTEIHLFKNYANVGSLHGEPITIFMVKNITLATQWVPKGNWFCFNILVFCCSLNCALGVDRQPPPEGLKKKSLLQYFPMAWTMDVRFKQMRNKSTKSPVSEGLSTARSA